ncbi:MULTISPECIES: hypothetical protein [Actinokineospora]|uniref:Uncharacterized protein n=1 Tax=Actinokineospora fastidiosa TaxID=1816 RepID=A0A918GGR8_9PSEU|nr:MULTISPECIES: hypothetical protein [Actinokineospora]UVS80385.1 hypothetical protein Actkin_04136 [Actinokineospora sp. UTMC 2448]GGS34920.1 hypothetical protein GCM10010171_31810 [Actinokineospora fastidiosa]
MNYTTPEQVDLVSAVTRLADTLEDLLPLMRNYANGLIVGWATPEKADALAGVLEQTARLVREHAPHPIIEG